MGKLYFQKVKERYIDAIEILRTLEAVNWRNVFLIGVSVVAFLLIFAGMGIVENDGSIITALLLIVPAVGWLYSFILANR